jgi:Trypsin-co-occurring domain 2
MKLNPSPPESLFIKDLIRKVHDELLESRTERISSGEPAIFEVEKLTIEVNFVAIENKEARAGIEFRVITVGGQLGGGNSIQQQQIHRATLELVAIPPPQDDESSDILSLSGSRFRPREEDEEEG